MSDVRNFPSFIRTRVSCQSRVPGRLFSRLISDESRAVLGGGGFFSSAFNEPEANTNGDTIAPFNKSRRAMGWGLLGVSVIGRS
jgi:hypothetical protein